MPNWRNYLYTADALILLQRLVSRRYDMSLLLALDWSIPPVFLPVGIAVSKLSDPEIASLRIYYFRLHLSKLFVALILWRIR